MAGITITLPTSQAEIPAVLADLRAQFAAKQAEVDAIRGAINAVQAKGAPKFYAVRVEVFEAPTT